MSIRTSLTEEFGIEYPVFSFTPSKAVAAAVTRAGGMGVLGCVRYNDAAELDEVLTWMDENTDGKPYGVDLLVLARGAEAMAARFKSTAAPVKSSY